MILRTLRDYHEGYPPGVHMVRSHNHAKLYRYGQEAYYQESSWELAMQLCRPLQDYARFTFVLLKPDAFVARAAHRILAAIRNRGFRDRGCFAVQFDRFMIRELWRYEFNVARVERYPLIDELLCAGQSVMVLLEDTSGAEDASIRLSAMKGNSNPANRAVDSLRTEVEARAGTLNFIHTPDEFIDFVRETGILLDRAQRAEMTSLMDDRRLRNSMAVLAGISETYPEHSLRVEAILQRLGDAFLQEVTYHKDALMRAPYTVKSQFVNRFGLDKWGWITLAATHLQFSHPGVLPVLEFETVS